MNYLIRLVQAHEAFRLPELESLAKLSNTSIEILFYSPSSPFALVRFNDSPTGARRNHEVLARHFISNSILSKAIYELWGTGVDYPSLHADVVKRSKHLWPSYRSRSFKFTIDGYLGKRSSKEQRDLINTFSYLGFIGEIQMTNPFATFTIFEEWEAPDPLHPSLSIETGQPRRVKRLYLGRLAGESSRDLIHKHDLKRRPYISTTSMDAELALVTATLALASPGKFFLDPFVGTGGFMLAASELEAVTLGSDIDGRSFRGSKGGGVGRGVEKGVGANFKQYGLEDFFGDCIISDLTNSPFRLSSSSSTTVDSGRYLDGLISDPPYGVREGLKVLGRRAPPSSSPTNPGSPKTFLTDTARTILDPVTGAYLLDGQPAHLAPGYIPPKRPYSFRCMLDNILEFAARTLVDDGRCAFWMPVVNEDGNGDGEAQAEAETETVAKGTEWEIPQHGEMELLHCCVQPFNKWSRRLLVYRRKTARELEMMGRRDLTASDKGGGEVKVSGKENAVDSDQVMETSSRTKADDLNPFRKRYFQGFDRE